MKKQKKNFKDYFENSMFSKSEFYIKMALIVLVATIFIILFVAQNGKMFFEFYPYAEKFRNNDFQVHVIDVGNGDALLIKFPNDQTMMIDTGDDYYEKKVTSYIQQYLWSEDLKQIDYLVLTHPDGDHVGGAKAILEKFKVANIFRPKIYSLSESEMLEDKQNYNIDDSEIYDDAIMMAYKKNCNILYSEAGISFDFGGCKLEFLAPLYTNYTQSNNYSAVIKIEYETKVFLFMGDAEKSVESALLNQYGQQLKADVLKVGHHGSYTSTSVGFVNVVKPEYAILSCKTSSYYPHEDVVENLNLVEAKMLTTGIRGSFALSIENGQIVYANANKPANSLAVIFTIFLLLVFLIWKNPFKKIKPFINQIKND